MNREQRRTMIKIATKNGCKIVVCTLKGTKEIVKNMFRRHHDVYFDVLDVIDTAGITQTAELSEIGRASCRERVFPHV